MPIGLTLYVIVFLVDLADGFLKIIPSRFHPDTLFGFRIPGLGILITGILIFLSGLITKSFLGRKIIAKGEVLVEKVPFVGSIYQGIKKVSDGMLADRKASFKRVVLVEFPRKGLYTLGFITGTPRMSIEKQSDSQCYGVFLPTTPNPTSGYLVVVPESELMYIDMSIEEALAYIISLGMATSSQAANEEKKSLHGKHMAGKSTDEYEEKALK